VEYKRVEKIDFDFSAIGFGCWGASGKGSWSNHGDAEQIDAIHRAIELGINFFDVAPVYGCGHAEEVLGKAIKGQRDKVFIATKIGLPWNENFENYNDVSAVNILKEIDDSLRRLDVEYVDLLQIHWPTENAVPLEETMDAMRQIKESGKARYIGLSNFSVSDMKKANEIVDIVSMQGLFNMLEHNATSYHSIPLQYRVTNEVFPYVKEEGMAFFPYSPLFQGLLTGKIDQDTTFSENDVRNQNPKLHGEERLKHLNVLSEITKIEELKDKELYEIAVNYLVAKPEITSVIATVMNKDEVEANVKALNWKMSTETVARIDKLVSEKL